MRCDMQCTRQENGWRVYKELTAIDAVTEIRSQLTLISGRRFLLLRLRPRTRLFPIIKPGAPILFADYIDVIPKRYLCCPNVNESAFEVRAKFAFNSVE